MPVRNDFAPGEFCWIDLAAHDLDSAAEWYGALFGWSHALQETHGGPPYAFMTQGDAIVAGLGQMSNEMKAMGIPPMWNNYICTLDCEATEAKVKELGGTVTVPTMDVPGHGKLAFFLDPGGASFAAWQGTTDGPGVMVGEPVSAGWNELMTRDIGKARDFYAKLSGWEYTDMPMGGFDYTVVKNAGKDAAGMMPMEGPEWEGVPAHWMVYFAVADCKAVAEKAKETGGQVRVPPTEIPVGTFSVLCDPQGATFCVLEHADCE